MVCPYCSSDSVVFNSRPREAGSVVWRRRYCPACKAVWTTHEAIDSSTIFKLNKNGKIVGFKRAILFSSLYESLKHRKNAPVTADELTNTILSKLLALKQPVIAATEVKEIAAATLKAFDTLAADLYLATH